MTSIYRKMWNVQKAVYKLKRITMIQLNQYSKRSCARNSINSLLRYYSSHLHIHIYSLSFALIPNNFLLRTVRTFSRVRRSLFEEETNPRRLAYIIAGNRWLREEHSASGTVRVKPFFGRSITRNSPPAFERGNKTSLARPIVLLAIPLYIYTHTRTRIHRTHLRTYRLDKCTR